MIWHVRVRWNTRRRFDPSSSPSAKPTVRICSLASQNPLKIRRIFDFYSALTFASVRLNSWVNALEAWVEMRAIWVRRTWLILWVGSPR
jgi:hypothetical protein